MFCSWKLALSSSDIVLPVSFVVSVEIHKSHYFWGISFISTDMLISIDNNMRKRIHYMHVNVNLEYADCILCSGVRPLSLKGVLGMILNHPMVRLHHYKGMLIMHVPLTLFCYPFLSVIALGKSSRWYPVPTQSWWM